jgi:uncharacterized glyoxalase superfamily protein PhnB
MSIENLNPYINFNGTADKAIRLYQSALGAKAETVVHYGDVPGMNAPPQSEEPRDACGPQHRGRHSHAERRCAEPARPH